jgi:hypothetical protein
MSPIAYKTGRTYDCEQVLEIFIESRATDDFGIEDMVVVFKDASRHIQGRAEIAVFADGIGPAVLAAYDAGRYQAI